MENEFKRWYHFAPLWKHRKTQDVKRLETAQKLLCLIYARNISLISREVRVKHRKISEIESESFRIIHECFSSSTQISIFNNSTNKIPFLFVFSGRWQRAQYSDIWY